MDDETRRRGGVTHKLFDTPSHTSGEPQKTGTPPSRSEERDHRCAICGSLACFGFDVSLLKGRPGRWACAAHREQMKTFKPSKDHHR